MALWPLWSWREADYTQSWLNRSSALRMQQSVVTCAIALILETCSTKKRRTASEMLSPKKRRRRRWAISFWAAWASALTAFMMKMPGRSPSVRPMTTSVELGTAASSSVRNVSPIIIATSAAVIRKISDLSFKAALQLKAVFQLIIIFSKPN